MHIFSVDVEDYFQVEAFSDIISRDSWLRYESRVEHNTHRVLQLLDAADVKATFFILGWTAERFPRMVREISRRGHELACHSYWHRLIYKLEPGEFRRDTIQAKDAIEQAAGERVYGYRAPSFSITQQSWWAFSILEELGFTFDSSIFPVTHDTYGIPGCSRMPFKVGGLTEFPLATFKVWNAVLPFAGGGYLRLLPFVYTNTGMRRADVPVVSYIHPWELDPEQPRINGARLKSRLRHYPNLSTMEAKVRKLLWNTKFISFKEAMHEGHDAPSSAVLEYHRA